MRREHLPFNEELFLEACRENGIEFTPNSDATKQGELFLKDEQGNIFKADDEYNPFPTSSFAPVSKVELSGTITLKLKKDCEFAVSDEILKIIMNTLKPSLSNNILDRCKSQKDTDIQYKYKAPRTSFNFDDLSVA